MRNAVDKMNVGIDGLMELMETNFTMTQIRHMSAEKIKLCQIALDLVDASKELTIKAVEMMEAQDRKLNIILEKLEKLEEKES